MQKIKQVYPSGIQIYYSAPQLAFLKSINDLFGTYCLLSDEVQRDLSLIPNGEILAEFLEQLKRDRFVAFQTLLWRMNMCSERPRTLIDDGIYELRSEASGTLCIRLVNKTEWKSIPLMSLNYESKTVVYGWIVFVSVVNEWYDRDGNRIQALDGFSPTSANDSSIYMQNDNGDRIRYIHQKKEIKRISPAKFPPATSYSPYLKCHVEAKIVFYSQKMFLEHSKTKTRIDLRYKPHLNTFNDVLSDSSGFYLPNDSLTESNRFGKVVRHNGNFVLFQKNGDFFVANKSAHTFRAIRSPVQADGNFLLDTEGRVYRIINWFCTNLENPRDTLDLRFLNIHAYWFGYKNIAICARYIVFMTHLDGTFAFFERATGKYVASIILSESTHLRPIHEFNIYREKYIRTAEAFWDINTLNKKRIYLLSKWYKEHVGYITNDALKKIADYLFL